MERDERIQALRRPEICPVCLDTLTDPVLTDCGHSLCWFCLNSNRNSGHPGAKLCPTCKHHYTQAIPNFLSGFCYSQCRVKPILQVKGELEKQTKSIRRAAKLLTFFREFQGKRRYLFRKATVINPLAITTYINIA